MTYLLSTKMSCEKVLSIPSEFEHFLSKADIDYRQQLTTLDLFKPEKTAAFSTLQKTYFAAVFYHIRGHFIDFMWYVANFTTDKQIKKIVLENIMEELGTENKISHEKLYELFAKECGVTIKDELINERFYLPFAREFNKTHLRWLTEHDTHEQFAAFSAYERLDNIDYSYLHQFVLSLNVSPKAMTFFKVHVHVQHFDSTLERLLPIWSISPEKVKVALNFIYSHQYSMWRQLSDAVFSLAAH
jgi:pyrroloquinoline quinone (PQQ) biosynthesis protein C